MGLREQIDADMKAAMKAREAERLQALRMIRAEILNLDKEGKGPAGEAAIVKALQRLARQRADSIEAYRAAGREDRAALEEAERRLIESYLPAEPSEAEVEAAVRAAIAESGATGPRDIGKVMGLALKAFKDSGKMVDGGKISACAKRMLGQG